ncbi:MAG TPA: hypothetical protein VFJ29_02570 [Candidatus Kapabacteria bacterium]|nr:hypothetical protein [Candidatus Kapabacteria bacterium]
MIRKIVCALFLTFAVSAYAQFPADALRLAQPTIGVGTRAIGMGSAFMPIADDYSALYWNPAGLGQLRLYEVDLGLSELSYGNNASFFGTNTPTTINSWRLDDIGAVFPATVGKMGLTFAVGYNKILDFTTATDFTGFNPNSSLINYETQNYGNQSLPYLVGLAGTVNGKVVTPVTGNLQQTGNIQEGGLLHQFSIGAGGDIADNLFVGVTLNILTGSYSYARTFTDYDVNNVYNTQDTVNWTNVNLYQYGQVDNISSDITGVNAMFGLLYKMGNAASFGVTVTTPTSFSVTENFSSTGQASFDNNSITNLIQDPNNTGSDSYDVSTPFVFSGGAAVYPIPYLSISGSFDFVDYTQLQFSNAAQSVMAYNNQMRNIFQSTLNYRLGAEYKIAPLGIGIRAGYEVFPSAYKGDPASYAQKNITGGVSFLLAKKAMLDLAYVHGSFDTHQYNYDNTSVTYSTITNNSVFLSFAYRFF